VQEGAIGFKTGCGEQAFCSPGVVRRAQNVSGSPDSIAGSSTLGKSTEKEYRSGGAQRHRLFSAAFENK